MFPEITPILKRDAPFLSLSFRDMLGDFRPDNWTEVDLVIGAEAVIASIEASDVVKVPLMREDFVTIVGPDHPLAGGSNGPRERGRCHTLSYKPSSSPVALGTDMARLIPQDCLATLPNFTILPILALLTGSAAYVPRMVALRFAPYLSLTIVEDARPSSPVTVQMAWHRRWDQDSGHRWLRELIASRFEQG